jgi:hypothetical protein
MGNYSWKDGYTKEAIGRWGIKQNLSLGSTEAIRETAKEIFKTNQEGEYVNRAKYEIDQSGKASFSVVSNKSLETATAVPKEDSSKSGSVEITPPTPDKGELKQPEKPKEDTEKPKEDAGDTKQPQSVPVKARGGKVSTKGSDEIRVLPIEKLKGDNSVVVNKENVPLATMNTKKETLNKDDKSGSVGIYPKNRVNPMELEKKIKGSESDRQKEAKDKASSRERPQHQQVQQQPADNSSMERHRWAEELNKSSQHAKPTGSFVRFVRRTQDFVETGSHFHSGSSNESSR